ncbi:hypothetical protein [Mesorhizobium sp.]|uniref:hypothetical protein n=1 Tax=Mesorhizobium sp. TaxID=1871066 RepID=UPI000FE978D5|nr:hypothetical protein [Mesorhizobium sp.]RWD77482.1 MAG: hypothetical protein EOS48_29355 [Mesorhizobium sp.]
MNAETSKTIAIDLGEVCGIAAGGRSYMLAGQVRPQRKRGETIVAMLLKTLNEVQSALGAARVIYTQPKRSSSAGSKRAMTADLTGVIREWAEGHGLSCTSIAEPNLKKRFTGNGNASFELMIAEAERRGFRPAGKAEAFAIALFHLAFVGQEVDGDFLSPLAEAL